MAMGGFFYLFGLPKRIDFVSNLRKTNKAEAREKNLKVAAEEKVINSICSPVDLCEYKPIRWSNYLTEGTASESIIHEFFADGKNRKYLFRMRNGSISEVINIY